MAAGRKTGRVEPVPKIWLSRKEAAAYLGVTEELLRSKIDLDPKIKIYRLSERTTLYSVENLDAYVRSKAERRY